MMEPRTLKRLALLLALCTILPLSACADPREPPVGTAASDAASETGAGDAETEPPVERANYGAEFPVLYCSDIWQKQYFFVDEDSRQAGNELDDRLYERLLGIKEYLGVDVVGVDGGGMRAYAEKLRQSVRTRDHAYRMVMTHVYGELPGLITGHFLRDFQEFPSLNLGAEYWNGRMMGDMAVNDRMYCGYNDFCLANVNVIAFNKERAADCLQGTNLYDLARRREWTLDRLIALSSLAAEDNGGDGRQTDADQYGISGPLEALIDFQIASDIPVLARNPETGDLYLSPMEDNQDKIIRLVERLYDFRKSDCARIWLFGTPESEQVHLRDGHVLFEMMFVYALITYKGEKVPVGVLPYPLWDCQQERYRTLNWNGVLGVPNLAGDERMVGDTIEMLAYSSQPVKTAFFENLLGAKVADSPDDAEMLNLIWASQVSDLGLLFCHSSQNLDDLVYAIPRLFQQDSSNYVSYYKSNERGARNGLRRLFRERG